MKKLIAVLFIVIPAGLGFGQTNPMADRVERLSKRFPPEVAAPASDRPKLSRRYCVSPSLEKNSLTVKPCQTPPRRLRLMGCGKPVSEKCAWYGEKYGDHQSHNYAA